MTTPVAEMSTMRFDPADQQKKLLFTLISLVLLGSITLFSATSYRSVLVSPDDNPLWMWQDQLKGYGLGALFFWVGYHVRPRRWISKGLIIPALFALILFLLATKFTPMGIGINDAYRWLQFGPVRFQPSELAKVIVPAFMIYVTGTWKMNSRLSLKKLHFTGFGLLLVGGLVPMGLIFIQPDWGTSIVVGALAILTAPRWPRIYGYAMVVLIPLALSLLYLGRGRLPEIKERLSAPFDPESVPQVWTSLQAVGSGGLMGKGLGEGMSKMGHLPSSYNDFIFAVYAEETGFFGVCLLLGLFSLLLHAGWRVANSLEDEDLSCLALVLTFAITGQALINLGVNVALLPTKGIALPFFSHGSTGLAVFLGMFGILFSLTRCRGREVLIS
ncbi:MAG: FtsW/RodA/SpoVE family cell cycle protein [Planctomycetota bacterium]|nr:FtsW/RodA/SpoVE family cell cycle protein [Planctomycetota bacterium]